jgi:hypothetical protein
MLFVLIISLLALVKSNSDFSELNKYFNLTYIMNEYGISTNSNENPKFFELLFKYNELAEVYEKSKCSTCLEFKDIPYNIKTVVFANFYENGKLEENLLNKFLNNDWKGLEDIYPKERKEYEFLIKKCKDSGSQIFVYLTKDNSTNIDKTYLKTLIENSNIILAETVDIKDTFPYNFYYGNDRVVKKHMIRRYIHKSIYNFKNIYNNTPELVLLNETLVDHKFKINLYTIGRSEFNINKPKLLLKLKEQIDSLCNFTHMTEKSQIENLSAIDDIGHLAVWAIILLILGPMIFAMICCLTVCKWCCGPSEYGQPLLIRGSNYNL